MTVLPNVKLVVFSPVPGCDTSLSSLPRKVVKRVIIPLLLIETAWQVFLFSSFLFFFFNFESVLAVRWRIKNVTHLQSALKLSRHCVASRIKKMTSIVCKLLFSVFGRANHISIANVHHLLSHALTHLLLNGGAHLHGTCGATSHNGCTLAVSLWSLLLHMISIVCLQHGLFGFREVLHIMLNRPGTQGNRTFLCSLFWSQK